MWDSHCVTPSVTVRAPALQSVAITAYRWHCSVSLLVNRKYICCVVCGCVDVRVLCARVCGVLYVC